MLIWINIGPDQGFPEPKRYPERQLRLVRAVEVSSRVALIGGKQRFASMASILILHQYPSCEIVII